MMYGDPEDEVENDISEDDDSNDYIALGGFPQHPSHSNSNQMRRSFSQVMIKLNN